MSSRVLSFHYVLTNAKGEEIDSSRGAEPFFVMEGAQQIIPGLEEELFRMAAGEKKKVLVPAAKAYGEVNEKFKMNVPRAKFPAGEIKPGMQFRGGPQQDAPLFTVIEVTEESVQIDGNHPLAGMDLTFDVEVLEIRQASEEELKHGHAHGPHGHHH